MSEPFSGLVMLITGASGFAGRHLAALAGDFVPGGVNLLDADATRAVVRDAQPERVFHLAARASVSDSWKHPLRTMQDNLAMTFNLLEAIAQEAPDARVLVTGSGEQYGPPASLPVDEDAPFRPQNPYAVSKCAVDSAASFFADARGLHVVRTRSFNHAGPGQSEAYVVSAFARQIAEAEAGGVASLTVRTGNLEPRRDFTDVRDVVRAYWGLLDAPVEPGAYNVCSGQAVAITDILARLSALTELTIEQQTDPSLLRTKDVMEIRGSHEKLTRATGWKPVIALDDTLADALAWWRAELAR